MVSTIHKFIQPLSVAKKMSNRSKYEMEQLKKFVYDHGIQDITIDSVRMRKAKALDIYSQYSIKDYYDISEYDVNMYKMSIPEDQLDRIVNTVTEFEELMRDPETAKLLMEARFIYRLKHGSKI